MKLKTFNALNIPSGRSTAPCIGVSAKAGLFNFNTSACNQIDLREGSRIQLHQDEDNPENWYLERGAENGFILRKNANLSKGLFFNSAYLARQIFDSVGYIEKSGRLRVGETIRVGKKDLVTLITAGLRNK